jgi:hypothetical protein
VGAVRHFSKGNFQTFCSRRIQGLNRV